MLLYVILSKLVNLEEEKCLSLLLKIIISNLKCFIGLELINLLFLLIKTKGLELAWASNMEYLSRMILIEEVQELQLHLAISKYYQKNKTSM